MESPPPRWRSYCALGGLGLGSLRRGSARGPRRERRRSSRTAVSLCCAQRICAAAAAVLALTTLALYHRRPPREPISGPVPPCSQWAREVASYNASVVKDKTTADEVAAQQREAGITADRRRSLLGIWRSLDAGHRPALDHLLLRPLRSRQAAAPPPPPRLAHPRRGRYTVPKKYQPSSYSDAGVRRGGGEMEGVWGGGSGCRALRTVLNYFALVGVFFLHVSCSGACVYV